MSVRSCRALAPLLLLACGLSSAPSCSCEEPPPLDETFDGNVVVGDASPAPDATRSDRGTAEAGPEDAPGADASSDDGGPLVDAAADASEEDSSTDAGPDCAPSASMTLTASAAVASAGALDGTLVEVTGTATTSPLRCTGGPCADGGSCCRQCRATILVDGVLPLTESECFASAGCSGTECTQLCRPPLLGAPQRFLGRLRELQGSAVLELYSVSP